MVPPLGLGEGLGLGDGLGLGEGPGPVVPAAQVMAASKSAPPAAVKLAAVVSHMNSPTRRAGAASPGIVAPLS